MNIDEEEVTGLLKFLETLHFKGEKLEADIRSGMKESRSSFEVEHRIPFGDERMRYRLKFIYDRQFRAYRLMGYKATHRGHVPMEHTVIDGIDTAELERRFATVDWKEHFDSLLRGLNSSTDIIAIKSDLWQLTAGYKFDGKEIQNKLIFLYWPEEAWDDEAKELREAYEMSHEFTAGERGISNAVLAYHITSGNLEELYDNISQSGVEQYTRLDLKGLLANHLSGSPEQFTIEAAVNVAEGVLQFHIPVSLESDGYHAEENHVTFTRFPEIKHGVFNGINSGALEDLMERINWEKDELYVFEGKEDVALHPHIQAIKDAVDKLSEHDESRVIADYLKVKYWADSIMEMFVEDDTWKMEDWQHVKQTFILEDDCKTIANLMRGKPVHTTQFKSFDHDMDGWLVIDPSSVTAGGLNPMNFVQGLTRAQIETMISMLPLDGTRYIGDIVRAIMKGGQEQLDLISLEGPRQIYVSAPAAPAEMEIKICTPDGKPIPFNFHLDPDWKPELTQTVAAKMEGKKIGMDQPSPKKKTRGKSHKR